MNEFVASNPLNHVDPFGDVWHHLFPWQFQDEFNDLNIDINSPMFGWDLPPEDHAKLHPLWNEEWEYFFTNNPDPTPMQVYEQLQDMRKDPKFCKYLKKGTKTEIPYPYRHTRSAYGRLIGKASKGGKAAKLLNAIGPILWGIQIGKGVAGGCDDELGNAKKELGCFAGNPTQLQCQAAMSSLATYAECLGMEEAISGLALHKAILEVCTKFK